MEDDKLNQARSILQDSWPRPLERSPLVDGRMALLLPLKLGAQLIEAIDSQVDVATDELGKLGETGQSEG